jgi:Ca2+-binding RTX toxin-like protein
MADAILAIPQEGTDFITLPEQNLRKQDTVLKPPTIINGTEQNDIQTTTEHDDIVNVFGGDDIVIGSKGNDRIVGGAGTDTMNYSSLGSPVRLAATGLVYKGENGSLGVDQLRSFETIVASKGAGDSIDGFTATGAVPINVNLALETLSVIDIPTIGTQNFKVKNFENVNGTQNNDIITGDLKNNKIDGGGGDDILAGTVGSFPQSKEVDILTGGGGNDKFILGSGQNLYYNSNQNADYAKITDFGNGADKIFLAEGNYATNDDLTKLFAVKADGSRDLIAKIAYSPGSGSLNQKQSQDVVFSDTPVDPLLANTTFNLSAGQSFGNFTAAVV